MAGLMEQLTDILKQQAELYDRLIQTSTEKRQIIVENDIEGLQRITAVENVTVGRLQKLDKNRVSIMNEIAIVLNIRDKNYTLTDLAVIIKPNAPEEYELLAGLIDATREKLSELKKSNDQNAVLIKNSLDYIDFSVNMMRSSSSNTYYDSTGEEVGGNAGGGFFDARQ